MTYLSPSLPPAQRATRQQAQQVEYERRRRVWRWLHALPGPAEPPQRGDLAVLWPDVAWCEDLLLGGDDPKCECAL